MHKRTSKALLWTASVVIAYNVQRATEPSGYDLVLTHLLSQAPGALHTLSDFMLSKWTLAIATFLMGMTVADFAVRRSQAAERSAGRFGWRLLTYRIWAIRLALRFPGLIGRIVAMRSELAMLNDAFQAAHMNLPALPCVDPSDHDGILATRRYLRAIGSISPANRAEARRAAQAIVTPLLPPQEQIPGASRRTLDRVRRACLELFR